MGVSTAPPTMAITSKEPPILVLGPSFFNPRAKMVGNISDMKKLVIKSAHNPTQPGRVTADGYQDYVEQGVNAQQFVGGDESHQVGGNKTSDSKSSQSAGEEVSRDFLGLVGVVLHILDEITPGSHLATHVEELGHHGQHEVGITSAGPGNGHGRRRWLRVRSECWEIWSG